jgi:hypothetical protein
MHKLLARAFTLLMALAFAQTLAAAEVGEDGLHKEGWFAMTFRDIGDDIAQARSASSPVLKPVIINTPATFPLLYNIEI